MSIGSKLNQRITCGELGLFGRSCDQHHFRNTRNKNASVNALWQENLAPCQKLDLRTVAAARCKRILATSCLGRGRLGAANSLA